MTRLSRRLVRETGLSYQGRPVVITIAAVNGGAEVLVGLHLKGTGTQYIARLADIFRIAALWHAQKVSAAKRAARKAGIPWKEAKKSLRVKV